MLHVVVTQEETGSYLARCQEAIEVVGRGHTRDDAVRALRGALSTTELCIQEGTRSLRDLKGLGRELWQDVDPVAYIRSLRDEWE